MLIKWIELKSETLSRVGLDDDLGICSVCLPGNGPPNSGTCVGTLPVNAREDGGLLCRVAGNLLTGEEKGETGEEVGLIGHLAEHRSRVGFTL